MGKFIPVLIPPPFHDGYRVRTVSAGATIKKIQAGTNEKTVKYVRLTSPQVEDSFISPDSDQHPQHENLILRRKTGRFPCALHVFIVSSNTTACFERRLRQMYVMLVSTLQENFAPDKQREFFMPNTRKLA